jgi:3-mercaptopyruvate sulfurtransferase SseA
VIRSHWFNTAVLSTALTMVAGCKTTYSDKDVHWLSIDEAKKAMTESSGSWLSEPTVNVWVDPRDAVFYRVGHIPGALNVQLSDPDAITRIEGYGLIMVYGEGYEAPIADAMIKTLLKNGQKHVKGLQVGFDGWQEARQKVERGDDTTQSTSSTDTTDRWQRQPVDDE